MSNDKKIDPLQEEWRKGYDCGVKNTLHQNRIALRLGEAILAILDERYEFAKEDY
jgi:hypothetical protein